MKYNHIVSYVTERPWAIREEKLRAIADILALRASGLTLTLQEIEARIGERREPVATPSGPTSIAVLPIFGVLSHRMNMMSDISGGTSTERISEQIRELAADPTIEHIVLDIDSEGGIIEGIPELWQAIFEARKQKNITAISNAMAASAAYWLGSAATEFVATPSGSVGSIGVFHLHMEQSKAIEEEGIVVTITRQPELKSEGNPFEPLSQGAKDHIQQRVDEAYGMFVRDVAKGRGVKVSEVRENYGQGRMLGVKDAFEAGMIDKIETLDQVLRRLTGGQAGKKRSMRAEESTGQMVLDDSDITNADGLHAEPGETPPDGGVVPQSISEELAPEDTAWEEPAAGDFTDNSREGCSDEEKNRIARHYAWAPEMPPVGFGDLALPHHRPSDGYVVPNAVRKAKSELSQTQKIPDADKPMVEAHLDGHMKKIEQDRERRQGKIWLWIERQRLRLMES